MPLDRCLFAVQFESGTGRESLERRVAELGRIYGPVGEVDVATRSVDSARVLLGVLRVGGPAELTPVASWGAPLPESFRAAGRLAGCSAAELRSLPGSLAAMAATDSSVLLVTGPAGVQSLFHTRGHGARAWSTHAVAASWLATGAIAVDPQAVAELVCWEFAGGDRTLLLGTSAVAPATRIALDASGAHESSYMTLRERWAPVPAGDAQSQADRRLLEFLDEALRGAPAPVLGLTGGADSRTAAVALRELGIDARAFTYVSDEGAVGDAAAAAAIAERLEMPHAVAPMDDHGDALRTVRAHALWADGAAPAGTASVPWPQPLSHWIAGVGAEVGRAFYYRWLGRVPERPGPGRVEQVLLADIDLDLGGAELQVRRRLRDRMRGWLAEAAGSGHTGWGVLDVLYGEQRVRRWSRAMTPRIAGHYVPAFASQPLMQALASLPLEDRLDDGFARRFVGARVPELTPARPSRPAGWPPPLARRRAALGARRARRALRLPPLGRASAVPWYREAQWAGHRAFIDWLADGVLASSLLEEAMGAGWQRETRANFLRGEPHAAYLASWAAGPVALAEAAVLATGRS